MGQFRRHAVLIVGGGPTGLTAGLLLARYGLRSIIVERHYGRSGQPKAHAINPRSLEIFRQIGLNTAELRNQGVKPEDGDAVRFVVSMAGEELGMLLYERQGEETKAITPEPLFNIPQPTLEAFLEAAVIESEMITLHRGWQWESCSQLEDTCLLSKVVERATGQSQAIESAYLLDCGGANTRAREQLGIPFEPLPEYQQNEVHHVSVHIRADLTKFKSGTLWWVANPLTEGTFICYGRSTNWVFVTYYDPKTTSREKFSEEYCRTMIDNAIGEKVPYEVLSISTWATWPRTADFYRSKRFPRAFVVGDAAHAFPPTGGLGVNTGIADAQNLAWKINAVERSWTHDRILDTYGIERRPVAVANAHQSVRNQVKLQGLKAALRDPPSSPDSLTASAWKKNLHNALQENMEHFDSINLQIGYIYGKIEKSDEPCNYYRPCGLPGARLPHTWISYCDRTISILDLIDGKSFVLFTAGSSTDNWAQNLSKNSSIPIRTFCAGPEFDVIDKSWLDVVGLSERDSGLLVRPDQHILGNLRPSDDAQNLLSAMLWP